MANKEIDNIRIIISLDYIKEYYDTKDLRYGNIMIMTDQNHVGSYIKGFFINFFHIFLAISSKDSNIFNGEGMLTVSFVFVAAPTCNRSSILIIVNC